MVLLFIVYLVGCKCDESEHGIRHIVIRDTDLGPPQKHNIVLSNQSSIDISYCEYTGQQIGFWGSETSPPFNILYSLDISLNGNRVGVPASELKDLANVSGSPMSMFGLWENDIFVLRIKGGDGIHSYVVKFRFRERDGALGYFDRSVSYIGP